MGSENKHKVRTRTRQEEYVKIVDQWNQSGLSQREYCNLHGYTYKRFQRWVWNCNKFGKESPKIGKIRISGQIKTSSETEFVIIYPNGVKLRLSGYPGDDIFTRIVQF